MQSAENPASIFKGPFHYFLPICTTTSLLKTKALCCTSTSGRNLSSLFLPPFPLHSLIPHRWSVYCYGNIYIHCTVIMIHQHQQMYFHLTLHASRTLDARWCTKYLTKAVNIALLVHYSRVPQPIALVISWSSQSSRPSITYRCSTFSR